MASKLIETDDDRLWLADRDAFGWKLPPLGPAWTRWPIVRTFRAIGASWRVEQHYAAWAGSGFLRSGYDDWVVYAIARGWC